MYRLSLLALIIVSETSALAQSPRFSKEREFSCRDIAEAVNHYVAQGEKAADIELAKGIANAKREDVTAHRLCLLCRILYSSKNKELLRPPAIGALPLPQKSMPLATWPQFPFVRSGDSYFLLSEEYEVGGLPENPLDYLIYCKENGVFLTKPVSIPTRQSALADLENLRKSPAWRSIIWNVSEDRLLTYLRHQARLCPEIKAP